jgi:hypothetical protein
VSGVGKSFSARFKDLATRWPSYAVVGSFVLYLMGYLALRFHLTVLGVGTDLSVLDERYVFTGAKFLVLLVAEIPTILLIASVPSGILLLILRLLRPPTRARLAAWCKAARKKREALTLIGITWSVLMIQLVMRQCFLFTNILLEPKLSQPRWLVRLLLDPRRGDLYLLILTAVTAVPALILVAVGKARTARERALFWLLAFLVLVQVLLLPVNYGVFIMEKNLPRVTDTGSSPPLAEGTQAWLVWEGKDGVTYLLMNVDGTRRTLLTVPHADLKRIQIDGYNAIFEVLFKN